MCVTRTLVFGLTADSLAEVCAAEETNPLCARGSKGVQWVIIITLQFTVMAILHTYTQRMSEAAFGKSHAA